MKKIASRKTGVLLCALLALTGCQALDIGGDPGPHDGRWVGRFTLSIGEKKCLRRVNMSAEVVNGWMSGSVKNGPSIITYNGRIDENGELASGKFIQRDYGNEGIMVGTFGDNDASGVWKNKRCEGKWTLRRVSDGTS